MKKSTSDLLINKKKLWRLINKSINRSIEAPHVFAVINILFEELLKDFKEGKELKIHNFGLMKLTLNEVQRSFNVIKQTVTLGKPSKMFKFKMGKQIKNKIVEHLDKFGEDCK